MGMRLLQSGPLPHVDVASAKSLVGRNPLPGPSHGDATSTEWAVAARGFGGQVEPCRKGIPMPEPSHGDATSTELPFASIGLPAAGAIAC
jgi:hypothetical protein